MAKQQVQLLGANTKSLGEAAADAGGRHLGAGRPTDAATRSVRRRKSEAQRQRSYQKLQHKHLQRRCEAAATKAGGSSPRVLARVLACCGRFLELLHPEGAARMERLRQQVRAAPPSVRDSGLDAMRAALAATAAPPSPMEVAPRPSRAAWVDGTPPPLAPGEGHRIKRVGLLEGRARMEAFAAARSSGGDGAGQSGQAQGARAGKPAPTYASKCHPRDSTG